MAADAARRQPAALPAPGGCEDAALGALLGCLVGDAAGAVLEFQQDVSAGEVRHALTFPGGGAHGVGPGQFTDDGELALCLARGLATAPPPAFPAAAVAAQYAAWLAGPPGPFDVGNTTMNAFLPGAGCLERGEGNAAVLDAITAAAAKRNQESKSNGCLMRCAPLAVWGHRLDAQQLAAAAQADCRLTNPNQACQDACAAYVIALAALIAKPRHAAGAAASADAWIRENACEEVRGWRRESTEPGAGPPCDVQIGFVRWAWVHAFRLLRRECGLEGSIESILLRGGDTDTNAAIVGAMIGALHGARGIPAAWRSAVLDSKGFEGSSGGIKRPQWLAPAQVPGLITQLMELAQQAAAQPPG